MSGGLSNVQTRRASSGLPAGAETPTTPGVQQVINQTVNNTLSSTPVANNLAVDQRVKIRVPSDYLTELTMGSTDKKELGADNISGIIFPYTPSINITHKADYTSQQPTHSNYALYFYKNSSVSDITISGKFTVQNESDAMVWLSTVRLLQALTKMRWGVDSDSGSPPPVCRLDAYGEYNFKNVPVVITEFQHNYPDDVDFYTLSPSNFFGVVSVPLRSTLQVICKPVYSRAEMQQISVSGYLDPSQFRGQGYL